MPESRPRLLVVQVAGLSAELARAAGGVPGLEGLAFKPLVPPFPAVTCTAQAVFRTARPPEAAGMPCNGRFDRETRKTDFWNQSAKLVRGPRIWDGFRRRGGTVGIMFWQQSLGEEVDLVLSPAPVHKHHGGMIQDCYGIPTELYAALTRRIGKRFNLFSYWGPFASAAASEWITRATETVLHDKRLAPDLLLTYLPHLDYVLQKRGPEHPNVRKEVQRLGSMVGRLRKAAADSGREFLIWGDYAVTPARRVVLPNRVLRDEGLFRVRRVKHMTYPDLYTSPAFAMVDHQVAHVFLRTPADLPRVQAVLRAMDGVETVEPTTQSGGDTECGDLVATAAKDAWFAYPWWHHRREAPDYATHVDIHNKIGFDPCELFMGRVPMTVSLDPGKVRGTHGRTDTPATFAASFAVPRDVTDLKGLAAYVREFLDG